MPGTHSTIEKQNTVFVAQMKSVGYVYITCIWAMGSSLLNYIIIPKWYTYWDPGIYISQQLWLQMERSYNMLFGKHRFLAQVHLEL